jgi:hypothetical protein
VRVICKPNAGRRARQRRIAQACDYVLCMDGDSALLPHDLRRAIRHFEIRYQPSPAPWGW